VAPPRSVEGVAGKLELRMPSLTDGTSAQEHSHRDESFPGLSHPIIISLV